MSRPLRIEFSGAIYHVMARGNGRSAIYLDDGDREHFLSALTRVAERFDWLIWAYCLMGNHYHLLVETKRPTLSKGMRELNGPYTQAFNRRHRRVGHVLQGRYKAILVDRDAYLLELSRYIVLNPVRAGLSASAAEWTWSSYSALMGKAPTIARLAVEETLAQFSTDVGAARRAYARFVAEGVDAEDPGAVAIGQIFLGDDDFVVRVTRHATTATSEVPRKQRAWRTLSQYENEATDRNEAIRDAYSSGAYTLRAIGEHFGLHYATVSRIARPSGR